MRTFLNWKENYQEDERPKEPLQNTDQIKGLVENSHESLRSALKNMLDPYSRQFNGANPFSGPLTPPQTKEDPQEIKAPNFPTNSRKKEEPEPIEFEEEEFPESHETEDYKNLYKLYKDREEIFECNVTVEGASIHSSQARLVIDTSTLNLVFYGKIQKDGKCTVPLKKMNFLPEKSRGTIRLEVIVDDTIFVPWESECVVEGAKKVSVQIKSKKKVTARI